MFTPNPNKNPCKLIQFDNLDESTGRWTKTKTAALPCPIEHTRVLNCFILATDEILVVVDEALIFLDQELNSLHFCQLETNFVYISCLAEGLPIDGSMTYLISGQVKPGKYQNVYDGWTDKNDRTLLARVALEQGDEQEG